jgi:hypothetical protein
MAMRVARRDTLELLYDTYEDMLLQKALELEKSIVDEGEGQDQGEDQGEGQGEGQGKGEGEGQAQAQGEG